MKKMTALLLSMVLGFGLLTGCGDENSSGSGASQQGASEAAKSEETVKSEDAAKPSGTGKLVLYASGTDQQMALLADLFEEETGIEVELVLGGYGEMVKRVESEINDPICDVIMGATRVSHGDLELFESYHSPEEANVLEAFRHDDGRLISFTQTAVCLIVNDELQGDLRIEGFADLLQPELKGKVALADPSASSNAYTLLINMLYVMGDGDIWSDAAWEYVEQLCVQLDGKLMNSSSDTPRAVSQGEYVVGLSLETAVDKSIKEGYPVHAVYMEEGTFVSEVAISIVKGGPNPESAQKYVDFLLGENFQARYAQEVGGRPVREGVPAPSSMKDTSEINMIPEFSVTAEEKAEIITRFNDLIYSVKN